MNEGYVDVIQLVFLYSPISTSQILDTKVIITLANLCQSLNKNWIENWTSLDSLMIIESACVMVLEMNIKVPQ